MSERQNKEKRRITQQEGAFPHLQHPVGSQSLSLSYSRSFLPPADELQKLEDLHPGITQKLIDNWISQGQHRQELEKFVIAGDSRRADKGQWMAFLLGVIAFIGGYYCIANGNNSAGITTMILAVATLLTAFYSGAILRKMERQNKASALEPGRVRKK